MTRRTEGRTLPAAPFLCRRGGEDDRQAGTILRRIHGRFEATQANTRGISPESRPDRGAAIVGECWSSEAHRPASGWAESPHACIYAEWCASWQRLPLSTPLPMTPRPPPGKRDARDEILPEGIVNQMFVVVGLSRKRSGRQAPRARPAETCSGVQGHCTRKTPPQMLWQRPSSCWEV